MLHIHAGPGTSEDNISHKSSYFGVRKAFRVDPCQSRGDHGVQGAVRDRALESSEDKVFVFKVEKNLRPERGPAVIRSR